MKSRTEVAGILRQLRLANIRNKYEAEEQVRKLCASLYLIFYKSVKTVKIDLQTINKAFLRNVLNYALFNGFALLL